MSLLWALASELLAQGPAAHAAMSTPYPESVSPPLFFAAHSQVPSCLHWQGALHQAWCTTGNAWRAVSAASTAVLLAKLSMTHQELCNCCQVRIKHLHFCCNKGRSLAEQPSALGLPQVGVRAQSTHQSINPNHLCQRNRIDVAVDLVGAASCPISQQSRDVERAASDAVLHCICEDLSSRVRHEVRAYPSSSGRRRMCTHCLPVIPSNL